MAYTPKQWVCGETITADGLNNIEEGVQEALDCCEDKGFECTESQSTVFEGSLTTTSMGSFSGVTFTPTEPIEGDSIAVTFNGTEYELPKVTVLSNYGYGDFDANGNPVFTNYPCAVLITNGQYYFFTPSVGTYQVVINTIVLTIETSECFEKAVKSASGLKYVKDYSSNNGGVVENAVDLNVASGTNSHAEGSGSTASGECSHAEGNTTTASGESSHAEGFLTTASGFVAHAEGYLAKASGGGGSHAEGYSTKASGGGSHAEGNTTTASGESSHAEGDLTTASGDYSHAQNNRTIAQGRAQTAIGKFNIAQGNASSSSATDYAFIIGNGTSDNARSNALAIKWDGTFVFANGTEITPAQFASLLALL